MSLLYYRNANQLIVFAITTSRREGHTIIQTFVSESKCLPLPVWDGMIIDVTDRSAGSKVNVTCQKGKHLLASGETFSWIRPECLGTGHWRPSIPQCVGKCAEMAQAQVKRKSIIHLNIASASAKSTLNDLFQRVILYIKQ